MSINLNEIKARAEAATAAPWAWVESRNHVYGGFGYEADQPGSVICNEPEFDDREADMIFIANARADIPALIAEIERLRFDEIAEQIVENNGPPEGVTIIITLEDFKYQMREDWGQMVEAAMFLGMENENLTSQLAEAEQELAAVEAVEGQLRLARAEIERLQAVNGQLVEACQAFVDAYFSTHHKKNTYEALKLVRAALEAARQE